VDLNARDKFWAKNQPGKAGTNTKADPVIDPSQREEFWNSQKEEEKKPTEKKPEIASEGSASSLKSQFEQKAHEQSQPPAKPAPKSECSANEDPCTFTCENGFTANLKKRTCECDSPKVVYNGKCIPKPQRGGGGPHGPQPSGKPHGHTKKRLA